MLHDFGFLKRIKLVDENGNLINYNNPLPIIYRFFYNLIWKSKIDFNKGSFNDTEVLGNYDEAKIQLAENGDNSDDVTFTNPTNYDYDPTKIEIDCGVAKLVSSVTEENNWNFLTPGEYTYDSDKIEVTGGVVKLKGTPVVPYAHWHLNEFSGSVASDGSGNGRNGTLVNMEDGDWASGKLNNCLSFDQLILQEYVNFGNIADFERTDKFSLEAWIKTTKTGEDILTRYSGGRGFISYVATGGKIYFTLRNTSGTNECSRYSIGSVTDNEWHHIVITYDGSSDNSGINIYIDGINNTATGSGVNTLTDSIQVSASLYMGGRTGSGNFVGSIDEAVIYEKELSSIEVSMRYNEGNGTENVPGAYPLDNSSIITDVGYVFTSNITEFLITSTKPSGTQIKYQLSSDDGVTWKYYTGGSWVISDGSYEQSNTNTEINGYIFDLASSGTLKVKALLHTEDEQETPELDDIYIAVATYPVGFWEISMKWDIQPSYNFEYVSITEIVSRPINTDIKYQYSLDSGVSYNGIWFTLLELEYVLQQISCVGDGSDKIRFKFQLSTSSTIKSPNINNLNVISDSGYKFSGTFESNIYNSNYSSLDWSVVNFNIELPLGTNLTIKVRASNDNGNMGEYSSALTNGEESNVSGKYIQWRGEFSGNGKYSPKIDDFAVKFNYPELMEVNP